MVYFFDRSLLKIFKDEPFNRNQNTKSRKKVDAVVAAPEVKDSLLCSVLRQSPKQWRGRSAGLCLRVIHMQFFHSEVAMVEVQHVFAVSHWVL